jgi:hypothetical protein
VGGGGRSGFVASVSLGSFFLALCVVQSASTWRTPLEWSNLAEASAEIRNLVPADAFLIAREAVLYFADRRGLRLEFDPSASRRAAGEWGEGLDDPDDPLALVEFYRFRAGSAVPAVGDPPETFHSGYLAPVYVADVGPILAEPRRRAWREAIRSRPDIQILVDRPDLLIAELP